MGIGKKFERATLAPSNSDVTGELKPTKLDMSGETSEGDKKSATTGSNNTTRVQQPKEAPTPKASNNTKQNGESSSSAQTPQKKEPYQPPPSNGISEAALNQLSNYLPSNIQMDQGKIRKCFIIYLLLLDLL